MLSQLVYWLKRPFHFFKTGLLLGFTSQLWFRSPAKKLKIIVVTGTDGKTTSSTLLYHVLKTAGKKVGLISTVAAYIGDTEIDTGFHVTAPSPWQVNRLMRKMVKQGYEYLVMETTSHGIYQYRTWGITPLLAGLTNITHEHIDYHVTYDNYVAAKTLLLKKAATVVINADDHSFSKVRKSLKASRQKIIEYSQQQAFSPTISKAMIQRFPEAYNQMNARLVTIMAQTLNITDKEIAQAFKSFPGIKGRMQTVPNKLGIHLIVDFAHTPHALSQALQSLKDKNKRQAKPGKIIAVFGCAGLRDRLKRPIMAKIAAELADTAIFTAEDPRIEDVWSIIRQMKEQLTPPAHRKILSIADRGEAVYFALRHLAQPGDWVGVFGKGHETAMCYGTVEYPWNDVEAINQMLPHLKRRSYGKSQT